MRRGLIVGFLFVAGVMLQGQGSPSPAVPTLKFQVAVPTPASPLDGRVEGVAPPLFARLLEIRARNAGLSESDVRLIRDAVMADGAIDAAERGLLDELIGDQVRSIIVSEAGTATPARTVVLFPASGKAREILIDTMDPPVDFADAWEAGAGGWAALTDEFAKGGYREARAEAFVRARLGEAWNASNMDNAFKPFRDEIGRVYDLSMTQGGARVNFGRWLVYNSAARLDREHADRIPDFLFEWVKPATRAG